MIERGDFYNTKKMVRLRYFFIIQLFVRVSEFYDTKICQKEVTFIKRKKKKKKECQREVIFMLNGYNSTKDNPN